jgi:hypothetical protein
MAARHQGSENAHLPQPVDDVGGNPPPALDFRGAGGEPWCQIMDRRKQLRAGARNRLLLCRRVRALVCANWTLVLAIDASPEDSATSESATPDCRS